MTASDPWICRECETCGGKTVLRKRINTNGAVAYVWWCVACGHYAVKRSQNIPHETVERWFAHRVDGKTTDDIPICADLRELQSCEICGSAGAELHHFAPQSLRDYFGDEWVKWPTMYLCKAHHDLWHSCVTPNMPHVRHTEIAQTVLAKQTP